MWQLFDEQDFIYWDAKKVKIEDKKEGNIWFGLLYL